MSMIHNILLFYTFIFFNDTATTEIYPLSLHDALPISAQVRADTAHPLRFRRLEREVRGVELLCYREKLMAGLRSEEHTSELQSQSNLVCRLLLEKKKKKKTGPTESLC